MAIVLNPYTRAEQWAVELRAILPDESFHLWPDVPDPAQIDLVVAWVMPRSALKSYTNLRAILSLGAGAEQWQRPGTPDVPVVRLADPATADEMAAYALGWVIRFQRQFDLAEADQRLGLWRGFDYPHAPDYNVGILGYGTIGSRVADVFVDLGYSVSAWSRTHRSESKVRHFSGSKELSGFLGESDVVINVLPSTSGTIGLIDAERLGQFKHGAVFINMGRGSVIASEQQLIAALDCGRLKSAVLDVTDPEPPKDHSPLFAHPAVYLTGHSAGPTVVRTAVALVAENIRRIRSGETPMPLLDRTLGY